MRLTSHNEYMDFIPFYCFGMMAFVITLAIFGGRK